MRVSSRLPTPVLALGAVAVAVALVLSGCTPKIAHSAHVAPKTPHLFADLHSYPGVTVVQDVTYDRVNGRPLKLDICLPHDTAGIDVARPAIVSIHGGSWAHGSKDDPNWRYVCQWLADSGYVTASLNYDLAPAHPFPAAIDEIEHAVAWLREPEQDKRFDIDPSLIGAFGGSAGGNLAALLGTSGSGSTAKGHRVAAVVELSGPSTLTKSGAEQRDFYRYVLSYLGCTTFALCANAVDASPIYHVDQSDPPFFVAHSTEERIPLTQSTAFVKRLSAAHVPVTFVTVKGHEHSIAMLDAAMRKRVIEFFRSKLVSAPFDVANK